MVAKNNCLMQLRDKKIFTDISITDIENEELDIETITTKEDDYNFLELSINELNEEQKICISLFYLQKKSYSEIVAATNFTLMQIKSHIQNGKRNLRILIEKKRTNQ